MKTARVHYAPLTYDASRESSDNLDAVVEMALKHRQARDEVREEFGAGLECYVKAGSLGADDQYPGFYVEFREKFIELSSGSLERALARYFSVAGTPQYVEHHSTWGKRDTGFVAVKEVLQTYGKRLSLEWLRYFGGGCKVIDVHA